MVVVGAGIGGLATAVALRGIGAQVQVHEQARALTRVGAGLQLAPNATGALSGLGLAERVAAIACRPESWCSVDAADAVLSLRVPLGDEVEHEFGAPYLHVHRGDLHEVLLDAVGDVHIGHRAVGVEQTENDVAVRFAGGDAVTADVVIGADGIHSQIRESLFGRTNPRSSGLVAYRGIVPRDRVPDVPTVSAKWWGEDRHLVHYWVSGGRELNFVARSRTRPGPRSPGPPKAGSPTCSTRCPDSPNPPGGWSRPPPRSCAPRSTTGIRCRRGARAGWPCWATPATRCCRSWRRGGHGRRGRRGARPVPRRRVPRGGGARAAPVRRGPPPPHERGAGRLPRQRVPPRFGLGSEQRRDLRLRRLAGPAAGLTPPTSPQRRKELPCPTTTTWPSSEPAPSG
ncbi:FAD-dependent monooxygenase [Pseudonocardia benzenivorans]